MSNAECAFDIIYQSPVPVRPDPYLVEEAGLPADLALPPPVLRVVR